MLRGVDRRSELGGEHQPVVLPLISLWLRQEFREDVAMQALVIATIPSVAAVLTAALGFRDLGMRRQATDSSGQRVCPRR